VDLTGIARVLPVTVPTTVESYAPFPGPANAVVWLRAGARRMNA
jgi:hypothetical protein